MVSRPLGSVPRILAVSLEDINDVFSVGRVRVGIAGVFLDNI